MYKITINAQEFVVDANTRNEALDAVADYVETMHMQNCFYTTSDIVKKCDIGEAADEYAKEKNLIKCGSNGIYLSAKILEV